MPDGYAEPLIDALSLSVVLLITESLGSKDDMVKLRDDVPCEIC